MKRLLVFFFSLASFFFLKEASASSYVATGALVGLSPNAVLIDGAYPGSLFYHFTLYHNGVYKDYTYPILYGSDVSSYSQKFSNTGPAHAFYYSGSSFSSTGTVGFNAYILGSSIYSAISMNSTMVTENGMITGDHIRYYCVYTDPSESTMYIDGVDHNSSYVCPDTDGNGNNFVNFDNGNNPQPSSPSGSFPYTGTGATPNTVCSTKAYTDPSSVTWYSSSFGTLTPSAWTSNTPGSLGFQDTANNGLDTDYFRGIFYGTGSYVPHDVMNWGNTGSSANVEYMPGRDTPASNIDPRIRISMKRNGTFKTFNVIQVQSINDGSDPSASDGATHAEFGQIQNGTAIPYTGIYHPCVTNGSGGCIITMNTSPYAQYADLHITSGMKAVRFGLSGAPTYKTSCQNEAYSCNWVPGTGSTANLNYCDGTYVTKVVGSNTITTKGRCGITAEGYCAPLRTFQDPGPGQSYVYDNSGAAIGVTSPYDTSNTDVSTQNQLIDDIFSCPDYQSWTDTPVCVKEVLSNIYKAVKNAINGATDSSRTGIINSVQTIGTGSGSDQFQNFGQVSGTGVNLADTIFRRSWNAGLDKNNVFSGYGRFALFGALVLMIFTIVLSVIFVNLRK